PPEPPNIRPTAVGAVRRPARRVLDRDGPDSRGAVKARRRVYFTELGGMSLCDVYDRYRLKAGHRLAGPAVVEEIDSTLLVHPGYVAEVDATGNILIEEARP